MPFTASLIFLWGMLNNIDKLHVHWSIVFNTSANTTMVRENRGCTWKNTDSFCSFWRQLSYYWFLYKNYNEHIQIWNILCFFFFNLSKREQVPLKWSGVQTDVSSCTNYLFLLTYIFAEALTPLTKYPHLFLFTRKCICLTITLVVLNSSIWMYLPKLKLANDIRTLSKYVIAGSIACSI